MLHCTVLLRFYKRSIISSHSPESAYIATSNKVGEHRTFSPWFAMIDVKQSLVIFLFEDAWFGSFIFLFNDCLLNKPKINTTVPALKLLSSLPSCTWLCMCTWTIILINATNFHGVFLYDWYNDMYYQWCSIHYKKLLWENSP